MNGNSKRDFILGDEWFYFKIYTGVKTADSLLVDYFVPMINIWKENNYINKWFFIRYYDPEFHLRIRVYLTDQKNILPIIQDLSSLSKTLMEQNLIWKLQTDTYSRELERYGTDYIEDIENIFYHDSEMIIKILDYTENTEVKNVQWLAGLYSLDSLLNVFKIPIERKKYLMERFVSAFRKEMNYDTNLKRQLSLKYRKNKNEINSFLSKKTDHNELISFVTKRDQKIEQSIAKIIKEGSNIENIDELIFSISHMSFNRLYRTKGRENEFVSYHLLLYYYESKIAQMKYKEVVMEL
ncbi:thiopeptide-type bacteriocin biosynthesis protein [Flavobacterium chungangense]|uniref:thiopeptide-type bacteriocin biosynthesis protein n=1 Tax=Flavobacterium chungangense TaxID=554283 RepID=UPI0004DEF9A8|nr:thiopeptide-type bacteriocin biosynthesis protein [Flavobacterium chungangense]